jgi:putative oxidoreductase
MASGLEPFGLEPSGSLDPVPLPTRSLGVVALVLFVLFATVVAGALWPIQLLDPLWQLKLSSALVNAAAFPLVGLALRQDVAASSSSAELNDKRQNLQGPVLGPADLARHHGIRTESRHPNQPPMPALSRHRSTLLNGIARLLLCLVFVHAVIGKLTGFSGVAQMMTARGLPFAPALLVAAMALMAVGSVLVISGIRARLGAILLLLFLVPTTLIFHNDVADAQQRIQLFKNLSIIGGLLLVADHSEG